MDGLDMLSFEEVEKLVGRVIEGGSDTDVLTAYSLIHNMELDLFMEVNTRELLLPTQTRQ